MSQQGNQEQGTKMYCIMCGGKIDSDSQFCYLCGAEQYAEPDISEGLKNPEVSKGFEALQSPVTPKKAEQPLMTVEPQVSQQGGNMAVPARKSRKWLIIGIYVATLFFAVIISAIIKFISIYQSGNALMRAKDSDYVMGTNIHRDSIKTVTFLSSLDGMPGDAWDVSAFGRRKVMAWVEERDDGYYDLYIGGNGGVVANKNSSCLFAFYHNVEEIKFNGNFHTEEVRDMSSMFFSCWNLTSVDVSGFDTSRVTDMSWMFEGCESLKSVDVSRFDTSNVIDMSNMFSVCFDLTSVDVSGFSTLQVPSVDSMFLGCRSLTSLNLRNFSSNQIDQMEIPEGVTVYQ